MARDNQFMRPLQGIQILSLAVNIPGPVAVARLCDWGARAVKIEPPGGDPLAVGSPAWYKILHHGVSVIRLDLKNSRGQAQLRDLLGGSDLLITSNRPASLARLGLDWPSLSTRYPDLCQVAILGYSPPDEEKAGHDLTYQAAVGLIDPPLLPRTVLADLAGAERTVSTALALLLTRSRLTRSSLTGEQRPADDRYAPVALADAAAAYALPLRYGLTADGGLLGGSLPGYNLYQAREGWVAVAALERHFLERLAKELGLTEMSQETLSEAFLTRPAEAWETWAVGLDLPIVAVRDPKSIGRNRKSKELMEQ
jgi:crotonobetainyl-CoA:carnitine CoA-transferase CaiB-like acyl-CoA transferase